MEQKKDSGIGGAKIKQAAPPPPPPRFWVKKTNPESVTKQEIAEFWRQKRTKEEEHLLAAIKSAARIRARNLSEEDYKRFVESLMDEVKEAEENNRAATKDENTNEIRFGIRDWWTESMYAYLNQPAIESRDPPKRKTSTYIPNCFSHSPTPLYPTFLGVFSII